VTTAVIPNRPVFRAQEVCELADVQPYVLRTWEAEFPHLGVAKGAAGSRIYRRADVELVLKIKHLLFAEGLTLAGVRRRLSDEGLSTTGDAADVSDRDLAGLVDDVTRQQLVDVRRGLQWILAVLAGRDAGLLAMVPAARVAPSRPVARRALKKTRPARVSRAPKRAVRGRKK
jgi:DNA-binding transcriptional MerR regulator